MVMNRTWLMSLIVVGLVTGCGDGSSKSHGGEDAFVASVVVGNVIADVTVDPAKVGDVVIHAEFAPPGGKLEAVQSVVGQFIPPSTEQSAMVLWFENDGANHFHSDTSLATPGEWTLALDVTVADGSVVRYELPVTID